MSNTADAVTGAKKPSLRDQLRSQVLKGEIGRVKLTFHGGEIELIQPSIGEALGNMQEMSASDRLIEILTNYVMVPDTNDKLFEAGDADTIRNFPFNKDVRDLLDAFNKLCGVDVEGN